MIRKKSFQIETKTQRKALTDTDYDSNYDEIFENYSPKLDRQTPAIDELDIHSNSGSSSEIDYRDGNNEFFQDNDPVNSIGRHGQDNGNSLTHQSNNTSSMANFDILRSSPSLSLDDRNNFFLTSAINWEPASTKQISIKVKEVENIHQVINTHFNHKARPWQVGAIIDITKRKRDVCAIADTSTGKNLIYQSIPVITGGSVLVISPTITLMKDQVYIVPKMLYNHLYSTV